MAHAEMREWLGITWADLLIYIAAAAVGGMFFVRDPNAVIALAVVGIAFALLACPLGMKRNPELSRATNAVKLVTYPAAVVLAFGLFLYRYSQFVR